MFDNNTIEYWSNSAGSYTNNKGAWLDEGTTSEVWVERTIDSGTLELDTIGATRVAMTTDRQIGVEGTVPNTPKTAVVTVKMYDAASGGNLLQSEEYTLTAEQQL